MSRKQTTVIILALATLLAANVFAADPSADKLLAQKPPKYIVQANGKRLNSFISRDILILVDAYLASRDRKYLEGVVEYMNVASQYPDWRAKQHYLSASYIIKAFAVALDSLSGEMPEDVRTKFEDALMEKGLIPSDGQRFWNEGGSCAQACASAVAYGALAVRKRFPEASDKYLNKAIESTRKALAAYAPHGCYGEGPSYCKFATQKTDEMIALLKKHRGNDACLGSSPGYAKAQEWMRSMVGLTGRVFNFADGGEIFLTGKFSEVPEPVFKIFDGVQPTAIIKNSGLFLAVKGGKANYSMAHMDAGSFVFETMRNGDAVRWVEDLGPERVRRLEHAKIDVENYSQKSSRWSIFRHGPFSHSTFTIDGKLHDVDGFVPLSRSAGDTFGLVADCSCLYDEFKSAKRYFSINEKSELLLRDVFLGQEKAYKYSFSFCTSANVRLEGGSAVLEKNGRKISVEAAAKGSWRIIDISIPAQRYDRAIKG